MPGTDWEKAKKAGVDWGSLTTEDWIDFLDYEHTAFVKAQMSKPNADQNPYTYEDQRVTMEDIIGKGKTKPTTIFDYIKLISHIHKKTGLMTQTSKEGDRLRFFSHNSELQPPPNVLGPRALSWRKKAKDIHAKGIAAPPWTIEKVNALYTQFDQLSRDLTESPEWAEYWSDFRLREEQSGQLKSLCQEDYIKSQLITLRKQYVDAHPDECGITDEKVMSAANTSREQMLQDYEKEVIKLGGWDKAYDKQISDMQQQMLAAYRFKLFSSCEFVPKQPDETPNQHKMRQFRIQDFLQQLNKNMRKIESGEITVDKCYLNVKKQLEGKLDKDIATALENAKDSIRRGTDLDSVISNLESEITRAQQSKEAVFLGEAGQEKIIELKEYQQKLIGFRDLVNKEMETISQAFLPTTDKSQSSVIKRQIADSAQRIIESDEFSALPEIGSYALENAIQGPAAIDKLYESGIKVRTDHFYNRFIPDEVDTLLSASDGIQWIENLRTRREVIEKLYSQVKEDNENFKKPNRAARFFGVKASSKKNEVLKKLQTAYMDTLEEDMLELYRTNPKLAQEKISHIQNRDIGKAAPSNNFGKVLGNAFSPLVKFFGGKTEKSNVKDRVSNINEKVKKVKSVDKPQEDSHPEMSHRRSVCENLSSEFLEELRTKLKENPDIQKVHVDPPSSSEPGPEKTMSEMIEMVADTNQHKSLLGEILKIKDPHERMGVASQLFSQTFATSQGDVMLTNLELDMRFQKLRNSLQDVYIDGIQETWKIAAKEKLESAPEINGQQYLTREDADEIMNDIILPELDSEIMNMGTSQRLSSIATELKFQKQQLFSMCQPMEVDEHSRKSKAKL